MKQAPTLQQRAAAMLLLRQRERENPPQPVWQPHPDNKPQQMAYESLADETLYGGSAGGGKTALLLGLARMKHTRSLLLRRIFPDLERSMISSSLEFFGPAKLYNGSRHVWNVDGRRIEFGHMARVGTATMPKDEANYASAEYDLIAFDQLEQFPPFAYDFMLSRARSSNPSQRVRIIASANPVGENIEWIIRRWRAWLDEGEPNPAKPGELRYYKREDNNEYEIECAADDPDAMSRTFIPAGLKDNPYLGDDYRKKLNLLPEPLRSALMNGDWKASITDDAYQVIPRAWIKDAQARWKPDGNKDIPLTSLSVDVARGGADKTVILERYSNWFAMPDKHAGSSTPDGQSVVTLIEQRRKGMSVPVMIDVIGVGSSAYDFSKDRFNAVPVNFAAGSDAKDKSQQFGFANIRAECYWRVREALDPMNSMNIALPPDPEILGDLASPRWLVRTNGITIESKDDIHERLGRSPDVGDAIALSFYAANPSIFDWTQALRNRAAKEKQQ